MGDWHKDDVLHAMEIGMRLCHPQQGQDELKSNEVVDGERLMQKEDRKSVV